MSERRYALDQFMVITMHGKLFIASAEGMKPVPQDDGNLVVKGYYYNLEDGIEMRTEQDQLVIIANEHPELTEVKYTESKVSTIEMEDINTIRLDGEPKRIIQLAYLSFDGESCVVGDILTCNT